MMLSDNKTNFITGDGEIRELVAQIDKDRIQHSSANKGVAWHWNPPAAGHFRGVFESMIKPAKRAIVAIFKDEELETCFIGMESLLNSRPLTTVSDDPNDEPVLTPKFSP